MSRLTNWLRNRRARRTEEYLPALATVHRTILPRNYFEIGVSTGRSLALASVPSVAVDPNPKVDVALAAPVRLYPMTSDRFFAEEVLDEPIDFAFIDGMHRVEFVLRDFMNIEARAHAGTVVAMDDVMPEDIAYTARDQTPGAWTGDVYRIIPLLRRYRPDLDVRVYDVVQKGLGIVTRLDPSSRVLPQMYDRIVAELDRGAFLEASAAAIRAAIRPRPTTRLASDLAKFRRRSRS
ncbi:MAG: class I SAM-dependent methyltransferase [Rhizobiales bacterium]|nr:class I SAM-dependent methyltransferase [Hyphomicrobiales bacterium]